MSIKHKTLIIFSMIFIGSTALAGLRNFRQDFAGQAVTEADKTADHKQEENQETPKPAPAAVQAVLPVLVAQAQEPRQPDDSKLNNFYNDFKNEPDNRQPAGNGGYYYHSPSFPPDYYRYYYPYYYPYYDFYPQESLYNNRYGGQMNTNAQNITQAAVPQDETHTWYNASLDYQSVSGNLSAVGMIFDLVFAGKIDALSWGVRFDYDLYTEKEEDGHFSLLLYNIGFVIGKQLGKGLVETFVSYASLGDVSGLSLKLSTDQWLKKNFFLTGTLGVSIINNSPLTDSFAGAGLGNSIVRFTLGYQSKNSVDNQLNGPHAKLSVIF